jgi:calcineurin-like phosphoesterase family protein
VVEGKVGVIMYHFVSDTHWGHARVIEYSKRPFKSVEEMNCQLIANWNKVVAPTDVVWHLGDFAFLPYDRVKDILRQLNGTKRIVLGNHDKVIWQNKANLLGQKLFASIESYHELHIDKKTMIVLFHYGQRVWNKSHRGSIQLYGHSHGSLPPFGKSVDVGVDSKEITEEYRPVSLDEVLAYMAKRETPKIDHHGDR